MKITKLLASTASTAAPAIVTAVTIAVCTAFITIPAVADEFNRTVLPIPDQPFKGKTGLRPADSAKDFPVEVKAPEGAPNIARIADADFHDTAGGEQLQQYRQGRLHGALAQ